MPSSSPVSELRGGGKPPHPCDAAEPLDQYAKQLLLPNRHHFADHFLMVRPIPDTEYKVATLNLASGDGSPFEFRDLELDTLYTYVKKCYSAPDMLHLPSSFVSKMKTRCPEHHTLIDAMKRYYETQSIHDMFGSRFSGTSRIFSGIDDGPRPTILRTNGVMLPALKRALKNGPDDAAWMQAWFASQDDLKTRSKGPYEGENLLNIEKFWKDDVPGEYYACTSTCGLLESHQERTQNMPVVCTVWQFIGDYYQTKFVHQIYLSSSTVQTQIDRRLRSLQIPGYITKYVKPTCIADRSSDRRLQDDTDHAVQIRNFCKQHRVALICFSDFNDGMEQALASKLQPDWSQVGVEWSASGSRDDHGSAIYALNTFFPNIISAGKLMKGDKLKSGVQATLQSIQGKRYRVHAMYMDSSRKTKEDMGLMNDDKEFCNNEEQDVVIVAGDFNTNTPEARTVMQDLGRRLNDEEADKDATARCSVYKWRSPLQWQLHKCEVDSAYKDWILISDARERTKAHLLTTLEGNRYVTGTRIDDQALLSDITSCNAKIKSEAQDEYDRIKTAVKEDAARMKKLSDIKRLNIAILKDENNDVGSTSTEIANHIHKIAGIKSTAYDIVRSDEFSKHMKWARQTRFVLSLYNPKMQALYTKYKQKEGKLKKRMNFDTTTYNTIEILNKVEVLYFAYKGFQPAEGDACKEKQTTTIWGKKTRSYPCLLHIDQSNNAYIFNGKFRKEYEEAVASVKEMCPLFTHAPAAIWTGGQ